MKDDNKILAGLKKCIQILEKVKQKRLKKEISEEDLTAMKKWEQDWEKLSQLADEDYEKIINQIKKDKEQNG